MFDLIKYLELWEVFMTKMRAEIYWSSVCGRKGRQEKSHPWAQVTEHQYVGHADGRSLSRVLSLLM